MKNHYNVLELDKNCTTKEIKESYLKLSKKYHPDKNKSKEAEKKIVEINEAYTVLKNKSSRELYDQGLQFSNRQGIYRQNENGYNYKRPVTYDEYMQYYQKTRAGQDFTKYTLNTRKVSIVICCCMLLVFGAGLRIMYACSESHRRRKVDQMTSRRLAESAGMSQSKNPEVEKFRLILNRRFERKTNEKKSE